MSRSSDAPWLVVGGSGAVGRFLLRALAERGQATWALSRDPPPDWARGWHAIEWRRGALADAAELIACAPVLLSAGPLDALADACAAQPPPPGARVVALSSLSILWKAASPDPEERRLAQCLVRAEQRLATACSAASLQLLRAGLIWGAGVDRSLSALLRLARRWGGLPWPQAARGLRQPVHAADLAQALLIAAVRPETTPHALHLPGPDALPFDRMLDRMLAAAAPTLQRWPLPCPRWAAVLAWRCAGRHRSTLTPLLRAFNDQSAAADDWRRLNLQPRGFDPTPMDFVAWS